MQLISHSRKAEAANGLKARGYGAGDFFRNSSYFAFPGLRTVDRPAKHPESFSFGNSNVKPNMKLNGTIRPLSPTFFSRNAGDVAIVLIFSVEGY